MNMQSLTTWLELVGLLLLVCAGAAGVGLLAGPVAAVATAGALLLVLSWALQGAPLPKRKGRR